MDRSLKEILDDGFAAAFGGTPQRYFAAPGRTEIGGNHTDHQQGTVLAAAVDMEAVAAVRATDSSVIRVLSVGYPLCQVDIRELTPVAEEEGATQALVRGVAAGIARLGWQVGGFDAYIRSEILPGSGLSSSAAFEVLIGTVINGLFCGGSLTAQQIAGIGQYAENVFFGKPCGLMDQMASAVGSLVQIDFGDPANLKIRKISCDLDAFGYKLCIVDSRASHAELTDEYAAIPGEMKRISAHFGCQVLSQVAEETFYNAIAQLREAYGDRAVLRAMHFYDENRRAAREAEALAQGDLDEFLRLVAESGRSSWMYLQNVVPTGSTQHQEMALTLALCQRLLGEQGAFRVHGGGFAGTVQAFVPTAMLKRFRQGIEQVLGKGACHVLRICDAGGRELTI